MAAFAGETAKTIPWWKEPNKDQWYAWWAAWLGWTLVRFHRVPADHGADRERVRCAARRSGVCADYHVVDASRRSCRRRLARRPDRAQKAADDFDRVVFAQQLHRRVLADLMVFAAVPRAAGHRHGGRMAGRRGTRDGNLAGALTRLHERHSASLGQSRLSLVEHRLRSILRLYRLARHAVDRHPAGFRNHLRSHLRQRTRGLGREPTPPACRAPRDARPAFRSVQAGHVGEHAGRLLVHGSRLHHLLLDQFAVRRAPPNRSAPEHGDDRDADRPASLLHPYVSDS